MNDPQAARPSPLIGITSTFRGITAQITLVISVLTMGFFFAKHTLGTVFRAYDDEGYMLISLAHYLSRGHLYTETFSQYGPFYFYAQDACFRLLGLPVTHDAGRFVTLLYWMAAGFLGAWCVHKISNSLLLAAAAGLACIRVGTALANEPGHPQQVVLVLLLLAACLSVSADSTQNRTRLFFLGAVGAALFFTKINVGVFYIAALAHTVLCLLRPNRLRAICLGLMVTYAVLIPVFLMRASLHVAAVFCLIAVLSGGATFAFASLLTVEDPMPLGRTLYPIAGFVSVAMAIVIATRSQGMSLHTLLEGVLLQPLRQPSVFSINLEIGLRYLFISLLFVICVSAIWLFRDRLTTLIKWIGFLRCAAGLGVLFLLLLAPDPFSPDRLAVASYLRLPLLALCSAVVPMSVVPWNAKSWRISDLLPRIFIADLAVTQLLQAYPVAGSQVSIAAAPIVLWAFVSIADGINELPSVRKWVTRPALTTAFSILIILALSAGMFRTAFEFNTYMYPPSKLRGSASLHLPREDERMYFFLSSSIAKNCSILFSMPGMNSFNFWTGVPAPNGSNHNGWMRAFSPERQQQILNILQSDPRSCVVYNKTLVQFWGPSDKELDLPLARYITDDMPRIAEAGDYEIKINPKRDSPWSPDIYPTAPASPQF